MTLEYETAETDLIDPALVLDEYTDWFIQVVRAAFFPGDHKKPDVFKAPESYAAWLAAAQENKIAEVQILKDLSALHDELIDWAKNLISETTRFSRSPSYEEFNKLTGTFEEFISSFRRVNNQDRDSHKLDALTGLRTRDIFYRDIRIELDRLARQGKTFSIALIRIDGYYENRKDIKPDDRDSCLKTVADAIKKIARSFDDAYYMQDDFFIISLKQTESSGGINAIKRLNEELIKNKSVFMAGGKAIPLTVSSCVAEPQPNDNTHHLFAGMKKGLGHHAGENCTIFEHVELSPLQQFLLDDKKNG